MRENESGMEREKEGEEQARERAETAGEEARTKNVDKVYEEVITEPGEDGRETMDASGVKVAEAPAVEHASEANVIESGIEQPLPSQASRKA